MKAVVVDRYGGPEVATVADLPDPVAGPDSVLVRVAAASVGASDAAFRSGTPWFARLASGLLRPRTRVLGSDFAGRVVAVGGGVEGFAVGDRIAGQTGVSMGGHAELIVVPTDGAVVALPDAVGDAAAVALCDGGLTALPFLRDAGRVQAGERVLVIGASGSVGSHAVQLARWLGAHVTAVTSTSNLELVKNLGAHEAIDYRERDVTASSERWDVVFDAVGATDWRHARRILAPSGRYLRTVPSWDIVLRTLLRSRRAVIAFTGLRPRDAVRPDLAELVRLAAEGVLEPLIDGSYPLSDAPAAYARVDSRRKRGTVVLAP